MFVEVRLPTLFSVIDDYPPNSHLFLHDSSSLDTQEVQLNFLIFVTLSI